MSCFLLLIWTLAIALGAHISIGFGVGIPGALLDIQPTVQLKLVSLTVCILLPLLSINQPLLNLTLIFVSAAVKGFLTGFFLVSLLLTYKFYAWLVGLILQFSDAVLMIPIFVVWQHLLLREYSWLCIPCFVCLLILILYMISVSYVFSLYEAIIFTII